MNEEEGELAIFEAERLEQRRINEQLHRRALLDENTDRADRDLRAAILRLQELGRINRSVHPGETVPDVE